MPERSWISSRLKGLMRDSVRRSQNVSCEQTIESGLRDHDVIQIQSGLVGRDAGGGGYWRKSCVGGFRPQCAVHMGAHAGSNRLQSHSIGNIRLNREGHADQILWQDLLGAIAAGGKLAVLTPHAVER